ncbi:unnamed protein product [Macrosiphum euphorbiae]|uniref:Uncharacterized protein n=1 Tax=Macrosiphum euphorbiae TaxID=13131 RepID=A0AAV0VR77_9HEMI|nr:unnamed protein product [Macrosiphum euphorbiae]
MAAAIIAKMQAVVKIIPTTLHAGAINHQTSQFRKQHRFRQCASVVNQVCGAVRSHILSVSRKDVFQDDAIGVQP